MSFTSWLINLSAHQKMSWIKKLWYIYTMEFYAAERKKELIPLQLESIMLSEIRQAVKDKYHMISPTSGT